MSSRRKMLAPSTVLQFSVKSREASQLWGIFFTKIWECCILHKNELEDIYSHLGYTQRGRQVIRSLKAAEPKTGTAAGQRANRGVTSVAPDLTPYQVQGEVARLTEFTKQNKSVQCEANVDYNNSKEKSI